MAKNIEMNYKQGESEYEVLYPNVKVESVIDIEEHYYTKNEINGQISDIIPNPYGVLAIKATDDEGNPVSVQLTVNPQVDGSSTITTDSDSGLWVGYVNPGTYNLTAPAGSDFIEYNIDVPSAQVKTNQVTNVNVGVNVVQSGEIEITSSRTIQFPANFNIPVDIWGCGGGASGLVVLNVSVRDISEDLALSANGASGAYTFFLKSQDLTNQSLQVVIGSGGSSTSVNGDSNWDRVYLGKNGGTTSVKIGNGNTTSAAGGTRSSMAYTDGGYVKGANGGSGGGAAAVFTEKPGYSGTLGRAGNGGQNGGNGGDVSWNGQTIKGGNGKGIDTHIFQDSSRTLCCSGTGGMTYCVYTNITIGNPGQGAGNNVGDLNSGTSGSNYKAGDGISYGSSGGSLFLKDLKYSTSKGVSGAGKQGVVYIRWPSQST